MVSSEKADIREVIYDSIEKDVSIVDVDILYKRIWDMKNSFSSRDLLLREDVINKNRTIIDALIIHNQKIILGSVIKVIKANTSITHISKLIDYICDTDNLREVEQLANVDYNNRVKSYVSVVEKYASYINMFLDENKKE